VRRETFPVAGPLRVELKVPAGEVEIEAVETDEAVVELEPLGNGEQAVEDARVELRGDELRIEVQSRRFTSAEVRVRVTVPSGSDLSAAVASADLSAHGRLGETELKAASGDVELAHVAGLRLKGASGDVEVGHVDGESRVQVASGDLQAGHLGGEAAISSASGDVHVVEADSGLKVQTASGDQRIGSVAQGRVELTSASGDVRVGIRRGSGVWIDARSASGEVSSDLDVGDESTGGGEPVVELRVTTMSGDVEVVRA
jgi:DUF4097 and DUF4098 domain-containing protein YvlB